MDESGIHTSAPAGPLAAICAGSTGVTVTGQPPVAPDPADWATWLITLAMSGAAATVSAPPGSAHPAEPAAAVVGSTAPEVPSTVAVSTGWLRAAGAEPVVVAVASVVC
jgi:hypothetical protein